MGNMTHMLLLLDGKDRLNRWMAENPGEELDYQRATLRGIDLEFMKLRATFVRADLTGARLKGTDLTAADMRSCRLGGADLTDANLRGLSLSGAYMPHARLDGACLVDVDFRGASCYGVSLHGADLTGTILDLNQWGAALLDRWDRATQLQRRYIMPILRQADQIRISPDENQNPWTRNGLFLARDDSFSQMWSTRALKIQLFLDFLWKHRENDLRAIGFNACPQEIPLH